MSAGRLCTAPINPLKPMARNSSLGENVPPQAPAQQTSGGGGGGHLAPPQVTPDSPRPQKSDQSPLAAAAASLTIPLPTNTQQQQQKPK